MPEWASALIGVAVGGVLTMLANELLFRRQWAERNEERRERWRRDAAEVLGPVLGLLWDAAPDPIAVSVGSHTRGLLEGFRERWEVLKRRLEVLGAAYPDDVQEDVRGLIVSVSNALTSLAWLVSDPPSSITPDARQRALDDNQAARDAAARLIALVRGNAPAGEREEG